MIIKTIDASFAEAIGKLEALAYPKEFRLGKEDFRQDLKEADERGENFSLGAFQDSQLVAYLVAYVVESEKYGDQVVYGSDLAVHPDWQNRGLGTRLVLEVLRQAGKFGLACEAECRASTFRLLSEHPEILAQLGYRLAESEILPEYNAGEDHWWIRLEPINSKEDGK